MPPAAQETRALPLLVVDDDAAVRRSLGSVLASLGYAVETAESGQAALALLVRGKFAAMLCDVRMPQLSGLEVIPSARDIDPDLAIIMVSAVNEAETATQALRAGAVDYVTKPIEIDSMKESIERALNERAAARRRSQRSLREAVAARTSALEREKAALRGLTISTAEALLKAMEAKDPYLKGHSTRVSELAGQVAQTLGLDAETIENVHLAGRLADIGKIGTREDVLHKNGPLTPEEFDHVQDHVRIGLEILAPLNHLGVVLDYVHDHHEHYDGTGYPRALEGSAISIGGRILAAADAFVALTSRRAYREPMSETEAIEHLRESAGSLLDWTVYAALRTVIAERLGIALD
ncbi:MAG TPA: HD domain-containing phosphohydrolase [Gemmatimonadaceae bacterium]|nr:HD domain-containing phosphohydrolase [Gemmatimonadaceae bacterium]